MTHKKAQITREAIKKTVLENPEMSTDDLLEALKDLPYSKSTLKVYITEARKDIPVTTQIEVDKTVRRLKEGEKDYKKKYKQVLDDNEKLERQIEMMVELPKAKPYIIKADPSIKSEATVITQLSDIHFEQRIDAHTVNYLNEYNPDIAKQRLENYFRHLRKLTDLSRKDVTIKDLVIHFGGDFLHGFIHEEYHRTNYLTPIDASYQLYEILISGLNYLLDDETLNIRIICNVGNHSRTTHKCYTDKEAQMSYEWGLYKFLAKNYEHTERISFQIDESYFSYVKIYDKVIRTHHGHNVKFGGGIGGITVPLIKFIHRANLQIKADLDLMCHYHTRVRPVPYAMINGCVNGFDSYALSIGASPEPPSMNFQLLDKQRGLTINAPIIL